MASESKSDIKVLESDEECYYCFVPLHKGIMHYRKFVNEMGEIVYECDRCSSINEIEKDELRKIIEISKRDMGEGISAFEMDHKDMLAMSEMDSSLNGMADFESWMSAAAEVMKPAAAAGGAAAASASGDVKTVSIIPDEAMAEKIKKMQEDSMAEMDLAKMDWIEKGNHFLSPSEMEFIHGDGVHGPDSLSYQDWRSESVRVPVPKDGVSADSELGSLRSKWLHPVKVGSVSASGGASAAGGCGAPPDAQPPKTSDGEELKMTARQMWLLGLMDN